MTEFSSNLMRLRTHTRLNEYCLAKKDVVKYYRYYVWLTNNKPEHGWLEFFSSVDMLQKKFGHSRKYVIKTLKEGMGLWWSTEKSDITVLHVASPRKIVKHYNIQLGERSLIEEDDILSLMVFKASLRETRIRQRSIVKRESYIDGEQPDPWEEGEMMPRVVSKVVGVAKGFHASRKSQVEIFGVSKWTQRKWDKISGIRTETCIAFCDYNDETKEYLPHRDGELLPQRGEWLIGDRLFWQIPNLYYSHKGISESSAEDVTPWKDVSQFKRYYDDPETAGDAIRRGKTHEDGIYVYQEDTEFRGRKSRLYQYLPPTQCQ